VTTQGDGERVTVLGSILTGDRLMGGCYAGLLALAFYGFPIIGALSVVVGGASRPISSLYRALISLGSVVLFAVAVRQRRSFIAGPVVWAMALLALALLARLVWDSTMVTLPLDLPWDDYWLKVIGITVLPALPFLLWPERRWLQWSHTLSVWLGILATIAIGVGAIYSLRSYKAGARLATDVLNPISIGEAGATLFILATSIAADQAHRLKRLGWRGVKFLIAALGLVVCVLSASKGPIVGVAAIIVLLTVFQSPQATRVDRARGLLLLAVVAAIAAAGAVFLSGHGLLVIYERFSEIGADQSTAVRLLAWRGALDQFNASPLVGSAFVENYTRFYPHNNILEVMMTTGLVGLVLLMFLLLTGMHGVHELTRDRRTRWIALIFVQQVIGSLVSGSLYFDQEFWVTLFCVVAIQQATECSGRLGRAGMARDVGVPA
jgi:putative effector of murein hydrolase LrgA (UPF0299 family)